MNKTRNKQIAKVDLELEEAVIKIIEKKSHVANLWEEPPHYGKLPLQSYLYSFFLYFS